MASPISRRLFLGSSAVGAAVAGTSVVGAVPLFSELPPVNEMSLNVEGKFVTFQPDIEPLVQLIERTPRAKLLEVIGKRVCDGLSYSQLLAALLLAGIRNVQPRPAVGFKFHAVLVVHSAHLASVASQPEDRWLPIFWALDEFKKSQARDIAEGDWTMPAVEEVRVSSSENAVRDFERAMQSWDEEAADASAAAIARSLKTDQVFDLLAKFAARDFRNIGHKAIYLANGWRTLETIGWQYTEPIVRSLAFAALARGDDANPSTSDLPADRSWRENERLVNSIQTGWKDGRVDANATEELLGSLRTADPTQAAELVVQQVNSSVSSDSIFDALHLGAAELLMRQSGIVALHAVTTTNAMRYLFNRVGDERTRKLLLLQAAAYVPQFRASMEGRGELADIKVDQTFDGGSEGNPMHAQELDSILALIRRDPAAAAQQTAAWLADGNDAKTLVDATRRLVFLKGDDSHDYKFSSAVFEDYQAISPKWRNNFLAASTYSLRGSQEADLKLVDRIRAAL